MVVPPQPSRLAQRPVSNGRRQASQAGSPHVSAQQVSSVIIDVAKSARTLETDSMKTVNIGKLRDQLSAYLQYLRRGKKSWCAIAAFPWLVSGAIR
jgi:hypothetical protein